MQEDFEDDDNVLHYVHHTLNSFRQETIPVFYKNRKIHHVEYDAIPTKPMFKTWKEDTPETYASIMDKDYPKIISEIV